MLVVADCVELELWLVVVADWVLVDLDVVLSVDVVLLLVVWLLRLDSDLDCVSVLVVVKLLSDDVVADCVELDALVVVALVAVLTLGDVLVVVADCVLDDLELLVLLLVVVADDALADVVVRDCVLDDSVDAELDDCSSHVRRQNMPSRSPYAPTAMSSVCVWNRNRCTNDEPARTSVNVASHQMLSGTVTL